MVQLAIILWLVSPRLPCMRLLIGMFIVGNIYWLADPLLLCWPFFILCISYFTHNYELWFTSHEMQYLSCTILPGILSNPPLDEVRYYSSGY